MRISDIFFRACDEQACVTKSVFFRMDSHKLPIASRRSCATRLQLMGENHSVRSFVSRCVVSQLVCSGSCPALLSGCHVTIALNLVRQRLTAASDNHHLFAVLPWALLVGPLSAVASA